MQSGNPWGPQPDYQKGLFLSQPYEDHLPRPNSDYYRSTPEYGAPLPPSHLYSNPLSNGSGLSLGMGASNGRAYHGSSGAEDAFDVMAAKKTQKKVGSKVRWPDLPADQEPQSDEEFSPAFPAFVSVPPKASKSLPSSRRNSLTKDDFPAELLDPFSRQAQQLVNPKLPLQSTPLPSPSSTPASLSHHPQYSMIPSARQQHQQQQQQQQQQLPQGFGGNQVAYGQLPPNQSPHPFSNFGLGGVGYVDFEKSQQLHHQNLHQQPQPHQPLHQHQYQHQHQHQNMHHQQLHQHQHVQHQHQHQHQHQNLHQHVQHQHQHQHQQQHQHQNLHQHLGQQHQQQYHPHHQQGQHLQGKSTRNGAFFTKENHGSILTHAAPPQFSDHFLLDDETEPSVGSPVAPSYVKKYLQNISNDSSQFPVLLRRDSIPGMLSASSAALDLAPLPQTRRGSNQWDPLRGDPLNRFSSPLRKEPLNSDDGLQHHDYKQMTKAFSEEIRPIGISSGSELDSPDQWDADGGKGTGNCKFFRQGFCSRGERCKFSHSATPSPAFDGQFDGPSLTGILGLTGSNGSGSLSLNATPSSQLSASAHLGSSSGSPTTESMGPNPNLFPLPLSSSPSSLSYSGTTSPSQGYSSSPPQDPSHLLKNLKISSPSKKGHKRSTSAPEAPRFPPLEQLVGQIYSLCRDQHGCRYLQKKLEEGKEEHVEIISNEIGLHILELMSDPFGNYLCQKLFIYANEAQRTQIAARVVDGLVEVSLNMHGTRSVQKLIDCMTTPEQIALIIKALRGSVVKLIKDLNGNHVIQKCLNKLAPEQNQFIYDAVTEHCIEVASHRHGCCVLQRCIDHASNAQKAQLAREITNNALPLVQDAFGNYVVQYILDLNVREFSNPLVSRFFDHVFPLSLQKFSSNVIEKCIRVAEPEIRRGLIAGVIDKDKIPIMLHDAFANYVIQTSLDVADNDQHQILAELVRPFLPAIRHLPYCKRVQSKLNRDHVAPKMHALHYPFSLPLQPGLHH